MKTRLTILLTAVSTLLFTQCGDDGFPVPPASTVVDFTITLDNEGFAPCVATFTNTSIVPDEAGNFSYNWIIDTSKSSEKDPTHSFSSPGIYDATLTIISEREIIKKTKKVIIQNPNASGTRVFFGDRNSESFQFALINDDNPAAISLGGDLIARPYSIIADTVNNNIYYTGYGSGNIFKSNYEAKTRTIFRTGLSGPAGLGIDYNTNELYWTTDNGIQKGSLSSDTEVIDFATGIADDPEGLYVDNANNKVYWITYDGGVWVKNTNGTGQAEIIPTALGASIIIHNNKIYYHTYDLVAEEHAIKIANLAGVYESTFSSGMDGDVYGMFYEPEGKKIYWTDQRSGQIKRADPDGTNAEIWLESAGTRIYGMALGEKTK
jgi:hypothetical protein